MGVNGYIDKTQSEYIIKTNRNGEVKLKINSDKNVELYEYLINKLTNSNCQGLGSLKYFYNELLDGEEKFKTVTVYEQSIVLLQILKGLKCNAETCDLKLIDLKAVCKLLINKNITDVDMRIVYQSPCGLTERERKV